MACEVSSAKNSGDSMCRAQYFNDELFTLQVYLQTQPSGVDGKPRAQIDARI
jgi:hypothetical protein